MNFYDQEARDCVRFVWNNLPSTKIQSARCAIPQAVHYTPFANIQLPSLQYCPLTCKCEAVLNKYCSIDYNKKTFTCVFCGSVQSLPSNYANQISPDRLPYELTKQCSTFQCKISEKETPQAYLFVIDICQAQQQLRSIKQQIIQVLNQITTEIYVGVITFNKFVHVYELPAKINTVYCISGVKEYTNIQVMDILGLQVKNDPRGISQQVTKRFLVPLLPNKQKIIRRINDIKPDPFIYVNQRPFRATGAALNVAISIVQCSAIIPRIITFISGPCTIGGGKVIEVSFKNILRTQDDLYKNQNVEHYKKAMKYYENLTKRLLAKKIIIDMFAFTLQQFGLLQMKSLIQHGGGLLVMQEQFKGAIFKESFKKIFISNSQYPFSVAEDAQISVFTSKQISINGILGQCYSHKKKSSCVSENQIGQGLTHFWSLGSLDSAKTLTFVYQTVAKQKNPTKGYFMQFKTIFRQRNITKMRVTTVFRYFAQNIESFAKGFDQQAATICLARYAVYKATVQQQKNISSWIDKILFKFTSFFANYTKGDINSFSLPTQMKSFPQFIYHLRRCQLISAFGTSPDECYYYRHNLYRQTTQNCISMVQPALLQYSVQNPMPTAVMLDQQQMKNQVILLLDSYFVVLIWYGSHVKNWQDEGYHQQQGYQHLKQLLNSPNLDIDYIINTRFPSPNFYRTFPGHSKERYLKSRVNPKKSGQQNENLLTDDANIKAFTQYLVKLVVNQSVS